MARGASDEACLNTVHERKGKTCICLHAQLGRTAARLGEAPAVARHQRGCRRGRALVHQVQVGV